MHQILSIESRSVGAHHSGKWWPDGRCMWEWSEGRVDPRALGVAWWPASCAGRTPWGSGRRPGHSGLDWRSHMLPAGCRAHQSQTSCLRRHQTPAPSWKCVGHGETPASSSMTKRRMAWVEVVKELYDWAMCNIKWWKHSKWRINP